MADLRGVKCLTVREVENIRRMYAIMVAEYPDDDDIVAIGNLIARNDVAVAALRKTWFTFLAELSQHSEELLRQRYCDLNGITMEQATDLGIFEEQP